MKSLEQLEADLEDHDKQRILYKTICISCCCLSPFLGPGVVLGFLVAAFWGALWNGQVMYTQRIKEEIKEFKNY